MQDVVVNVGKSLSHQAFKAVAPEFPNLWRTGLTREDAVTAFSDDYALFREMGMNFIFVQLPDEVEVY